jgi:chromosome partitioning protein
LPASRPCLIDLDQQGTVSNWYQTRTAETPAVLNYEQVGNLSEVLKTLAENGFTLAIIDTKGEDTHATRGAMQAAQLCLIPIRPAGPDLHASRPTMEALRAVPHNGALLASRDSRPLASTAAVPVRQR